MAAMKNAAILHAVGALDDVDDRGVDEDQVMSAKPTGVPRCPRRRAERVTATDAEVISTSTPVA